MRWAVVSTGSRSTHSIVGRCASVSTAFDTPYPFLLNLRQDDGQVELTVKRVGSPDPETFTVGWVVGCDGAHSVARRRLGVAFDGDESRLTGSGLALLGLVSGTGVGSRRVR